MKGFMPASIPYRLAAGALLAAGAASGAACAATGADRPGDYTHAIPLSVSGRQAVVRLRLPPAVYLHARSAGLDDLRLFDAGGAALPFALVDAAGPARETRSTTPLAVFPVRMPAQAAGLPQGLQIRTADDGAVISVTAPLARGATGAGSAQGAEVLASLVLDLHAPAQAGVAPAGDAPAAAQAAAPVAALTFTLPPGVDSYSARVALEASDDLQAWEPVAQGALSWLVNDRGERVEHRRIAFEPQLLRYARLRWLDGAPLEFAAVAAERIQRSAPAQDWDSIVLQAQTNPAGPGQDLVYAAPPALPVQALGLALQGNNVVLPALIGQYRQAPGRPADGAANDLRVLVNTTFFQLTQDGRQRMSGDVALAPTHAAQWVMRPQARMAQAPGLRLRWQPATLVFVAGGTAPYTLAFGRDGVPSSQVPIGRIAPGFSAGEVAALEQARAGAVVQQRDSLGAAMEQGAAMQRRAWLWALLLAGVAALALMAWRLVRQLKDEPAEPPPT